MHSPDFMLPLLVNLAIHFPQAGRTPAQLQVLAEDWADDLAEFTPDVVTQAVKQYRRESVYFPTVADIWARCSDLQQGREARMQALPEATLTLDEQMALNIEWSTKIRALRDKADAKKQYRPDTPLSVQLAKLRKVEAMQ